MTTKTSRRSRRDPEKYLFVPTEYDRIPRWENDGISQHRREHANSEKPMKRSNLEKVHPIQRTITELLGEWPSTKDLPDIDPEGVGFILSLPYIIQKSAAQEQQNLSAAQSHLVQAFKSKDRAVLEILDKAGLTKAIHKASRNQDRFPAFEAVLAPLLQKKLATDKNLEKLFGDVAYVRGVLFELGTHIKQPPPANSPAAGFMAPLLGQPQVAAAQKRCGECGITENQAAGGKPMKRCLNCKSVHYCSRDCQLKAWPIHKPDCLAAQGKPVPAAVRAKAERAKEAREQAAKKKEEEDQQRLQEMANSGFKAFCSEGPGQVDQYLCDCVGKRLKAHLPRFGLDIADSVATSPMLGLKFEERLSLGMYPDGIDPDRYNFRGTLYSDPSNGGARIIFLFTYLYETADEPCEVIGYYIDGIFVVDHVEDKRAKWKLVPEPRVPPQHCTRLEILGQHLKAAKMMAKAVSKDVDLGIHNAGDPSLNLTDTPNGKYLSVNPDPTAGANWERGC